MLITVPSLDERDLEVWRTHERMDALNAQRWASRLSEMASRATDVIRTWMLGGPGYAGVSWGKDSVVVASLIAEARLAIPLVWVRLDGVENPDCPLVRDAFLARWPHVDYHEIAAPPTHHAERTKAGFTLASRRWGARYVSGVRAAEAAVRKMSIIHRGLDTGRACRPIGHWSTAHVYAYAYARQLPLHPAYAMTMGGLYDREHRRVAAIGGERGTEFGRAELEARYYGRRR